MTRTPIDASVSVDQNGQRRPVAVSRSNAHHQERLSPDALGNLGSMTNAELMVEARRSGFTDIPERRTELALQVLLQKSEETGIAIGAGILDVHDKGYGFLRPPWRKRQRRRYLRAEWPDPKIRHEAGRFCCRSR